MDFQFYPTPANLAAKAWSKFRNKDFTRVLEASAGNGDLAIACPHFQQRYNYSKITFDCCEIDVNRHAVLRGKGLNVVGMDFLMFGSGAAYSHIIMNPPFSEGAKHVLKAWEIMWDGEIVAIINAETIRNPFSKERELLASIIKDNGEVEFLDGAFAVPEAERKTGVEVALVYLRKKANINEEIVGHLLDNLKSDDATKESLSKEYQQMNSIALPTSLIENAVLVFNSAVKSMRDAVFAEARARYYMMLMGKTMAEINGNGKNDELVKDSTSIAFVQEEISTRYSDIKDRAWTGILRSSDVKSKLSSKAQKRLESEFDTIKHLEFTVVNIYGFLCGLAENQGKIQIDMMLDVFDQITMYHSDNAVFYKGWKSNDKHRTCGMRIKMTRFVLPRHTTYLKCGLQFNSMQMLSDFDKVFAMLDGKARPDVGLEDVFSNQFDELRGGARVKSSYFDVRYYAGIGTIHFFPSNKNLIDRLNRMVGRERQWIPPSNAPVSEDFWLQYEKAEMFDKELRSEVRNLLKSKPSYLGSPMDQLSSRDEETKRNAEALMDRATSIVLERHGINVDFRVEYKQEGNQMLLAA